MYTNLTSRLLCGVPQNLTPISATQKSDISDSKTGIERRPRPQPEVNRATLVLFPNPECAPIKQGSGAILLSPITFMAGM